MSTDNKIKINMLLIYLILGNFLIVSAEYTPIVFWHGMGDSCCNPISLGKVAEIIKTQLPGVYIKSLQFGSNMAQDIESSYFMSVNKQLDLACAMIKDDPKLQNGYNAIGFSQGGQFVRALAQRCPEPKMKNMISMGGQHQGVYGLPHCLYPSHKWCDFLRKVLNKAAYEEWVQNMLVQAQFWHDPLNEQLYRKASHFLSEINNERVINKTYVENLLRLENMVLVRFNNDTIVEPVDTEWFGFYVPGQALKVQSLQDSSLYKEDRLGLKVLNESGRLHFIALDGDHLEFRKEWFNATITQPFLSK